MTAPRIEKYMTRPPHTIGRDKTLHEAHLLMRRHRIRHLPVLEGGRLVGVLSLGDLHLIETLSDVNPLEVQVGEAMTADPYQVSPEAPLDAVADAMAERHIGSAIVVDRGHVVGIFTAIDALRVLAEMLRDRLSRSGDFKAAGG
jgi:acetoin utilization protein AcuB